MLYNNLKYHIIIILVLSLCISAKAQQQATIFGIITSEKNKAIELANISILGLAGGTISGDDGKYRLVVATNKKITIVFTHVSYKEIRKELLLSPGEQKLLNIILYPSEFQLTDIEIKAKKERQTGLLKIDPRTASVIPSVSQGIEAVVKTMPGVSSNNELSSQYSVRGGNFDENLVYVNDIEIYRPFLTRSGQQEGLSFVNSSLVSSILFSAGGFDAKYGDKMSSVLDITYKKPKEFAGSASASLLGASFHIEENPNNGPFSYLIGFRQKSNQYILKTLETKGDYKPSFTDIQTFLNYEVNPKLEFSFLGNYSRNKFSFIPETRETNFGPINEALRLTIYFDGQETDNFENYMGAFTTSYKPNNNTILKIIASSFRSNESEAFDIRGQYWLNELETDLGDEDFGNAALSRGVGTFLNHARNHLDAYVKSIEHIGKHITTKNAFQWGIRLRNEVIIDKLNEWEMLDSAGFTVPHTPDSVGYKIPNLQQNYRLEMNEAINTNIHLVSNRISSFIQNTYTFLNDSSKLYITGGIRANYWDLNKELVVSPRATLSYKPNWKKDILFRLSGGFYYQPPFYRELRDFNGNINRDISAQKSVQIVIGSDWNIKLWSRPFKFISELYYKQLDNLIPYEIDNVRIRYFAENNAKGYAGGFDMKLNGEFVTGIESWASLSIMKTQEDILNDYYYDYYNNDNKLIIPGYTFNSIAVDSTLNTPGYIPRPTDQRVRFSLFFQDFLPKNPNYKMHLNLVFASGLPFGPPTHERYKATLRIPPYKRVDIGFSKLIKDNKGKYNKDNIISNFKTIWIGIEVFNLLQISNTISYTWVTDVSNKKYAVPNYLTPRQLNIKIVADF